MGLQCTFAALLFAKIPDAGKEMVGWLLEAKKGKIFENVALKIW
jgi:hypothetical protein